MSVDPKIYRNFVQATGSPSDPKATNVTEDWTVISLLKGIWDKLSTGITATISGVSTAANQTTANTSLGSIDTKLSSQATAANQSTELTRVGDVTESAPANDTASSGLNGRLQRIAQRLTSLIALLPAAFTAGGGVKVGLVDAIPTGTNSIGTVSIKDYSNGEYETVAASQTAQALGASGATGDFIAGLLIIPATTSPGQVLLLDNATSITIFVGGASSVSNLVPFFVPLGMISVSGAWKVTTGANVSVISIGNFT